MPKPVLVSSLAVIAAVIAAVVPLSAAQAAPACIAGCVVTVAPGAQTSWIVPANASDVTVVVSGGAGGNDTFNGPSAGAGGSVTVDLGDDFNGVELFALAGDQGAPSNGQPGSGGGGSFVATTAGFLVVAGGGGGGGTTVNADPAPGGAGGFATSSADGGDGADYPGFAAAGTGAVGAAPGQPSTTAGLLAYGQAGSVASVSSTGVITPGVGGSPGGQFPDAQGGGGYAGGGGGSSQSIAAAPTLEAGAGGGGSGFLASGLSALATSPNAGAGSVTFTYSLRPGISAPAGSVAPGAATSTTVDTLPPSTPFTVLLSGTTAPVASGTTNANGDPVTLAVTIPASAAVGSHTFSLVVGGAVVAVSPAFTVTAATVAATTAAAVSLAETGVTVPWWVAPGALALLLAGAGLLWLNRRRMAADR